MTGEPEEGELLVIRRAPNVQRSSKDEQRESIFHSRCSIQGKVYLLIIDSWSYSIVASTTLIEKLGLETSVHPHPYCIQWLNQGKGLQVNSRCLVAISLGEVVLMSSGVI